jgi:hypothetical protein
MKAYDVITSALPVATFFEKTGRLVLPLPVAGWIYSRGSVDAVSAFVSFQIVDAMKAQYPVPVIVDGIGSFGGSSAFQRLPHRSVSELVKRYRLSVNDTCPKHGSAITLDICHGIPRSLGGNLTRDNLSADCTLCNRAKSNGITEAQWLALSKHVLIVDVSAEAMDDYTS